MEEPITRQKVKQHPAQKHIIDVYYQRYGPCTVAFVEFDDGTNIESWSVCSKEDEFDEATGRRVALYRALEKYNDILLRYPELPAGYYHPHAFDRAKAMQKVFTPIMKKYEVKTKVEPIGSPPEYAVVEKGVKPLHRVPLKGDWYLQDGYARLADYDHNRAYREEMVILKAVPRSDVL